MLVFLCTDLFLQTTNDSPNCLPKFQANISGGPLPFHFSKRNSSAIFHWQDLPLASLMKKSNWRISCNAFSWEPKSGNTSGCSLLDIYCIMQWNWKKTEWEAIKTHVGKFLYPSLPCMEQSSGLVSHCPEFSMFGQFLKFTSCHGHPEKVWQIEKMWQILLAVD